MKKDKFYVSSVVMMWIGVACAALAIIMMFVPAIHGSQVFASWELFFGAPGTSLKIGNYPAFIGYMLIVIGLIILVITAIPSFEPTIKTEKILLGSAIACFFIGAVLTILTYNISIWMNNASYASLAPEAGGYLAGIFSLGAMGCTIYALILDL